MIWRLRWAADLSEVSKERAFGFDFRREDSTGTGKENVCPGQVGERLVRDCLLSGESSREQALEKLHLYKTVTLVIMCMYQ